MSWTVWVASCQANWIFQIVNIDAGIKPVDWSLVADNFAANDIHYLKRINGRITSITYLLELWWLLGGISS